MGYQSPHQRGQWCSSLGTGTVRLRGCQAGGACLRKGLLASLVQKICYIEPPRQSHQEEKEYPQREHGSHTDRSSQGGNRCTPMKSPRHSQNSTLPPC